jgi:hypothetical protein
LNQILYKKHFVVIALLGILALFCLSILLPVWIHVASVSFRGGKNGPLDAYRHTLASAYLAHALGPSAVSLVTFLMESPSKVDGVMDRHNNALGATIGAKATRFSTIEPIVKEHIHAGSQHPEGPEQAMWLDEKLWREGWLW